MENSPGETTAGRIEIRLPQKTGINEDAVWSDLERYIFDGFLTSRADIQGQSFVFKTLNHNEVRYISFLQKRSDSNTSEFRASFIAHSVFVVNGSNALFDRPRHIDRLTKLFKKLPSSVCDKIVENLSALNDRANLLYPLVEAYVNENRSRYKWFQIRNQPINSPGLTGIPGSDIPGLNYAQLTWVALNNFVDMKETAEKDWSNAKFIGGCFAGKGMRTVEDRDRSRLERERTDKEELKEKVLHQYLNRTNRDSEHLPQVTLPDGRIAEVASRHRADTAEELAQQLTMALNHEKDAHDLAVEAYQKRVQERMVEIEKEKRELLISQASSIESLPLGTSVLSEAAVSARMKRMQQMVIDNFKQVNSNDRPLDPKVNG